MKRRTLPFRDAADWQAAAPTVARHLAAGGLLGHPTETVYGIGCALQPGALDRLASLKRREGKAFVVLVTGREMLAGTEWSADAERLAEAFWPGPLTLILGARPGAFPAGVLANAAVAVRATSHGGLRVLLQTLGAPMTSTSANPPGETPASCARDAEAALDRLDARHSVWLLDAGELAPSPPSTLVDCTSSPPRVVRAGATGADSLLTVVNDIRLS